MNPPYDRIFYRQKEHYTILIFLYGAAYYVAQIGASNSQETVNLGFISLTRQGWLLLALAHPTIFHTFVMVSWRFQLYMKLWTRMFRISETTAFFCHFVQFFFLFSFRGIFIVMLSQADANTFVIHPTIRVGLIAVILPMSVLVFLHVVLYFGLPRAAGADHYFESYRRTKLVKKGIFKYVQNPMYTVLHFAFYIPGLQMSSYAALVGALHLHISVWAHYFCTEKPDMEYIYGGKENSMEKNE